MYPPSLWSIPWTVKIVWKYTETTKVWWMDKRADKHFPVSAPNTTGSGQKTAELIAPALPELLWLPTVWRCPYIEIAFSTLDCSIVPTCGAWCSATAAKRGPLKQSWAEIQHSRDDEPLGVLMQMRNVRVNGFFFFSSLGVLPGVLVDTLSLCSGDFCVECVLIVLHKFYIEL